MYNTYGLVAIFIILFTIVTIINHISDEQIVDNYETKMVQLNIYCASVKNGTWKNYSLNYDELCNR